MKKFLTVALLSGVLILSSLFTPFMSFQNAEAKQIGVLLDSLEEASANYEKIYNEFESIPNASPKIKTVQSLIKNEEIKVHSQNKLDYSKISAQSHIESGKIYVSVPFKVKKSSTQMEGLVIILTSENKLDSYSEIHLNAVEKELKGYTTMWNNGNLIKDEVVKMPKELFQDVSVELEGSQVGPTAEAGFSDWYNGFSDCLSSKGVSWALIALAGSICGGACGVTFGAGCAPCFYGLTFLSGFNIGECFWKKY